MKVWTMLLAVGSMWLGACASEIARYPVESFAASQQSGRRYIVSTPAYIRLDSGYERTLSAGTELREFGTIKQGRILQPVSTVFTIDGAHMHEAYLVLNDGRIVGFYLPAEGAFSPLSQSVNLSIQERRP